MKTAGFFFLIFLCSGVCYAQKGKDGAKTITVANTIVNEYTTLTSSAFTGNSFLKVGNSALNTNGRFAGPLAAGDLLMIIQMQGATINGTPNDSSWGAITNYNNCGQYEFLEVTGVPDASTINFNCSIKNNYTASGNVQVIRVPRFSSLTVNSGGILTGQAWNGATGGVVAVEIMNNAIINSGGIIDADGIGFRGGVITNSSATDNVRTFYASVPDSGGQKGEGIAGFENSYNVFGGSYCRGAAANAGGGGNSNAAGGGGANAGDITLWTGNGNPDISNTSWIAAWNLEYAGFANSTSSGGGKGGRTASLFNENALVVPPGDPSWGYDDNRAIGGKGGRPLDYSTGTIFMGGGGGAGGANNNNGGSGGIGGGIMYLLSYGNVGGSGIVSANGDDGINSTSCGTGCEDPPGGAGGGGTVIINSSGTISGISINANGGKGGDNMAASSEAEGGGGGGGGGYIAISNGTVTQQANGGVNGITHSTSLTEFPPNGATKGGAGLINQPIAPIAVSSLLITAQPDTTLCTGQAVELLAGGGDSTTTYNWSPSTGLSSATVTNPVARPTVTTTYVLTATGNSCPGKDSVIIKVVPKVVITPVANTGICAGQSASLNPGGVTSYIYLWKPSPGLSCTNCANPSASPSVSATYTVIATNNYCSDTASSIITVSPLPSLALTDTTICYQQSTTLYPLTNGTLTWTPASGLSCTSCNNPQVAPVANQTYTITATLGNCSITDSVTIIVDEPSVSAGEDTTIYNGSQATLHGSGLQNLVWSPATGLSSSSTSNPTASPPVTTTYTLVGFDSFGCSATSNVVVFVNNPCDIPVLPNAFSPNGDGKNDIYKVINPFIDKLVSFRIYNRWGQLVFETSDINAGWDGTFNGKPEQVGAYVYYLEVVCQGADLSYKGNVTLIR